MKIGLSYSRCIRDIVDGVVDPEDVLVIISRTDFDPTVDVQWDNIWEGYTSGAGMSAREWASYDEDRKEVVRLNVKKYSLPMVYCNAVGSQTEIVFDGGSLVYNKDGILLQEMKYFDSQVGSSLSLAQKMLPS